MSTRARKATNQQSERLGQRKAELMATEKARDGEDKKQTKRKKKKKKKKKRRSSCSSLFCPLLSSLKKVIETNKCYRV